MKKKIILSGIMSVIMAASAFVTNPVSVVNTGTVSAEEASETTSNAAIEQLKGTWEGYYSGFLNNNNIQRTISLNIYYGEGTEIRGFAEITSAESEKYFFKGTYNESTGKISFAGTTWEENAADWGFVNFGGELDSSEMIISGLIDGKSSKDFRLEKTSDSFTDRSIKLENVAREWVGEYDGKSNNTVVRRNYKLSITDISDDGKVSGQAVLSPSEKADEQYAETGSYYFSGTIDESNGNFSLQGYEWIEHPLSENFTFVYFDGFIFGNTITGTSDINITSKKYGIWSMETTDIENGDFNFDNKTDAVDLLILKRYLLLDINFSDAMKRLTDINGDSSVNVLDFNILKHRLLNPEE